MMYQGTLSLGEFFSLWFYSFWLFSPLYQLGAIMKSYQEAKASNDVLEEIVKMPPTPPVENPTPIQTITNIVLDKVSFSYE